MTVETEATTPDSGKVSRRTLAVGAAWAVPAIAIASAAPNMAASAECITYAPGSCKDNDQSYKTYRVKIQLSSACLGKPCPNGTATITKIENQTGNDVLTGTPIVISLDASGNGSMSSFVTLTGSGNLANSLIFTVDLTNCSGTPGGTVVITQPAPPKC